MYTRHDAYFDENGQQINIDEIGRKHDPSGFRKSGRKFLTPVDPGRLALQ